MGKKGSWFSAIKRVFTHNSKEKPTDVSEKKSSTKGKKKGKGILSNGENKSFIPLFREPSSIEKILGEADHLLIRPPTPSDAPKTPPILPVRPISPTVASRRVSSPKAASPIVSPPRAISPPKAVSPKAAPRKSFTAGATSSKASSVPKVTQSRKEIISYVRRAEPSLANQHLSATTIQAAYRGYLARRSFRALKGLVRLQGVVRGQNVKRQTMSALKQMQLLVRVQTQIQSRRIQMLENQAYSNNNNQVENTLSKWTMNQLSEAGENGDWDDSSLTKEEVEARMRKKVEAVIKRERAMAYAYSHQLWKSTPKSAQSLMDIRSNGFPWWWNWLERQLPQTSTSQTTQAPKTNISSTPTRPVSAHKRSPLSNNYNKPSNNFALDNHDSLTPRSSTSGIPFRAKQFQTPTRTPPSSKYSKPRASAANSAYDAPLKDDDSLISCPPFSVPNYMAPTVSAKAKTRANSNPKERFPGTPGNDSNRRFSFPLTPNIGSFKWNKGSNKDSASQMGLEKHESPRSVGGFSMGSAVSMPALVGRKPFNRFV